MGYGIKLRYIASRVLLMLVLLVLVTYVSDARAIPVPLNIKLTPRSTPVLRVHVASGNVELSIQSRASSTTRVLVQRKVGSSPFKRIALLPHSSHKALRLSDPVANLRGVVTYRARFIAGTAIVSPWSTQVRIRLPSKEPGSPAPPREGPTLCPSSFLFAAYDLITLYRAQLSLAPLPIDPALESAAEEHSLNMALSSRLTHTGWHTSIINSGFKGPSVSQNIASGYSTFEDTLRAWLESPPHRGNFISTKWNVQGLGCVVDGDGRVWVTHNLGSR